MKKLCLLILVGLLTNCSDSEQPDIKAIVLENIKRNSFVLGDAFAKTAQILQSQGNLEILVNTSNSRDAFITKMNGLVAEVVPEVVEAKKTIPYKFTTVFVKSFSTSIQDNLKQIPVGIHGPNPGSGALELYSTEIDDRLDGMVEDIILIKNTTDAQGNQVQSFSFATTYRGGVSVSPSTIAKTKSFEGSIIASFPAFQNLDNTIEAFVADNPDTEILVGMLLPAIRDIQVNPSGAKSPYQIFSDLVFGTQITKERNEWDMQVCYGAFLAGIDFTIREDFPNDDENHASISLQDAMYHAACVLMWAKIYDLYKK